MFNILSSFFVGFLCTAFLFVLSIILTLGIKSLFLLVKDFLDKRTIKQTREEIKQPAPPKRKKRKVSNIQRSIEIDPSEIDRIYVKKSS